MCVIELIKCAPEFFNSEKEIVTGYEEDDVMHTSSFLSLAYGTYLWLYY